MDDLKTVAEKWQEVLKKDGYEHHLKDKRECARLKKFSRIWRKIFRYFPKEFLTSRDKSVFEFGCGGGKYLAQFLVNDWKPTGLDCSPEVLARARNYLNEVKEICVCRNETRFICADFLEYEDGEQYDLVFQQGVLEHFLDEREREGALQKMFALTKKGGWVVSIVPNGIHPLRQKMKELCLGGYNIPEIDYTPELMEEEMQKCGGEKIKIFSHNILGYKLIDNAAGARRWLNLLMYYVFQIIPPDFLPGRFSYKHGLMLVALARKK